MRDKIFRVIWGVALGFVLILLVGCVVGVLAKRPAGNPSTQPSTDMPTQTEEPSDTETESATETESESESETEPEYTTETETEIPTEVDPPIENPTESEEPSEPNDPSTEKPEPVEIPYLIKVNRAANCVTIYIKDENGEYTVPYKSMVCSVGLLKYVIKDGEVVSEERTPAGTFKTSDKYVWRKLFGDIDVWGNYTTRINGHILFHSVPYTVTGITSGTEKTLWEGQYNLLGEPASKGCIRLSVADAKWIYDNCPSGTTVVIYDDAENPGPLGKPEGIKISDESPYKHWDPTDPNVKNPWHNGKVTVLVNGVEEPTELQNVTIRRGETIDLLENVTATDIDGLPLSVTVEGNFNPNEAGVYDVIYKAVGVTGAIDTATIRVTVTDTVAPTLNWRDETLQEVVVTDAMTEEEIREMITSFFRVFDTVDATGVIEELTEAKLHAELAELLAAIAGKTYGEYSCNIYAQDNAGNKSSSLVIKIVYEKTEDETESETESETENNSESEAESESESTSESESETNTNTESEEETGSENETESELENE